MAETNAPGGGLEKTRLEGAVTQTELAYRQAELQFWHQYGTEPEERFVELDTLGTTIRVQEVGSGDPILFLHGSPTSGTNFAPLVASLDEFSCLIPDLPPGGLSAPFEISKDNVTTWLDHLVTDTLDAMGVERAHVVASSSGSALAMKAALRAPERVRGVVHLGAPWLVEDIPVPFGEKLLLVPGAWRLLTAVTPGRRMQQSMLKSIGHGKSIEAGRIPEAYWAWSDALFTETGTYAEQMRTLPAFRGSGLDYDPTLKLGADELSRQGPTLVIWGTDEGLASKDDAQSLVDRIPGARLELLADAGHLPWLDFPEEVAASVRSFLGDVE
ncbi:MULTISPECIES: alpha/beta fold hydrolase [Haloferax]|uniref:Alpha/beta fold hydrolase n=1 Tax=Haloferax marinum TaxID=2666143 RepID=A0A6A8G6L4_9EURY|nr:MULTISPECIES: alpha/beta hydrolase [Haloferax]KAB1197848.1 alpha/beta hydrolase [Haloferax sp. CBA1150]MRW96910.1 alpha/beta fold hydrolase [Haloferax marinum]